MKSRKTIQFTINVTAPKKMKSPDIRREVLTRINEICGHHDGGWLGLDDADIATDGAIRIRAVVTNRINQRAVKP
jgi:hypothetical protein